MTLSNHGHQPKYEYHLLKRDLRTAAEPPEIDLARSNHGHQSKYESHLLKRDLRTAADPPEIDLTLSNHGLQSKNEYQRNLRTAANPLKLTWHFQIMGTSPNMNIIF